ncbi:MAG TPA: class I SAM-dependent RNA methyltransferase [Planctomycetota bacterium]|nr:class I SAM-dependent RNA methyltransferase [Planctomycetota bacterium]
MPPTLAIGQIVEVTAERLAFGGFAIAHYSGLVLFVPFAAPGERLRVEVTALEKKHARARIVEILERSPQRREARCRHFGDCGGCHFQHLDYALQLQQKAEFVRDALVRTGGFDWPLPVKVHSAGEWGYRARTQLRLHRLGTRQLLGFHRAWTHDVIDVQECPVMAPALEQGLPAVRQALATLEERDLPYQIDGAAGIDGAVWAPDLPGLHKDLVEHQVGAFRYLIEPESFFQGHRGLVAELVGGAVGELRGALAFDLYAGVGLFSLPLSQHFTRVVAVEDERRAATLGRVNCKHNHCDNVSYLRKTTEQFLRDNRERPDLVLLDPPRLGARPALPLLLQLAAPHLVYVSCDPNTLARDLRTLCDGGYAIEQVEGYDMFPQTYHVECVARLQRHS